MNESIITNLTRRGQQAAATSVCAAVIADANEIGGKYLEDCAVAPVNDTPNPFADGVRSYALDTGKAGQLWAKSEAITGAMSRYSDPEAEGPEGPQDRWAWPAKDLPDS
jgi:hypothetical protein